MMAAPGKSSRWGSLLQQAVAGVEARLDTILADGEAPNRPLKTLGHNDALAAPKSSAAPGKASPPVRVNDRLQERLAKVVASKGVNPIDPSQHTLTPEPTNPIDTTGNNSTKESPGQAKPLEALASKLEQRPISQVAEVTKEDSQLKPPDIAGDAVSLLPVTEKDIPLGHSLVLSRSSSEGLQSVIDATNELPTESDSRQDCTKCALLQTQIESLQSLFNDAQSQHQAEIHDYIERLDALQAKLHFLSKEATESARKAALAAPGGSMEQKLAEKDEKMISLMEEGRTLAITEQKHRSIIKKLRLQVAENEKLIGNLRSNQNITQNELEMLRSRAGRIDNLEMHLNDARRNEVRLQNELDALKSDLKVKEAALDSLQKQLDEATDHAASATSKAHDKAIESRESYIKELEDTIASLEVEKNLIRDRAKTNATELTDKALQATEHARLIELEMKAELQIMESKLEAMRLLAEETSSGATVDAQAKLLRQVDTLQSQYATANENWQGIESSLLLRVGSLEKERDDALRRESDMRKKARDAAMRCSRLEEELQEVRSHIPSHQRDLESYQYRLETLTKRVESADIALAQARAELEKQQLVWKTERADLERRPWVEDVPSPFHQSRSRPDSPHLSVPVRTPSSDLFILQGPPGKGHKGLCAANIGDGIGSASSPVRRTPSQPPARPSVSSSAGPPSAASFSPYEPSDESLPTPLSHTDGKGDFFENTESSSLSGLALQDMVSVSTVAAGPSVQLVERMSAAIRRLEADKVASKEELARVSSQRDEARAEILSLMRDVELGKAALRSVSELEAEVAAINERYQTTLELLGEKSELVEELRADVEDMKAMYRDLVESTVRSAAPREQASAAG